MPKNTNQPKPNLNPVSNETEVVERVTSAIDTPATAGQRGSSKNIFSMAAAAVSEKVRLKSQLLSEVRQRLAEAADLSTKGDSERKQAEELANNQALRLYQARATGTISADELSGLLGDIFGFKPRRDGTPGKTPEGLGEVIRKRVVRCVGAHHYATGQADAGSFFDELPKAKVAEMVGRIDNGGLSIWQAYRNLSELRSQSVNRPPLAFDPKRIAAMVESLNETGAREKIMSNAALQTAYGALIDTLAIVGQVDDEETAKAA